MKPSENQNYSSFVTALKKISSVENLDQFPKFIVLTGESDFLRFKACESIRSIWGKLTGESVLFIESSELDLGQFQSLWSQLNLFEPESLYILRRAQLQRQMPTWLGRMKNISAMKSYFLIDCGDKLPAELKKQLLRLNATIISCVDPVKDAEIYTYIVALAKRFNATLDEDAIRLIIESVGRDISKISNEVLNLTLEFCNLGRPISKNDILQSVGQIREDDVFKLFDVLRNSKAAYSYVLLENFLSRGESAIALTGILARFAREQIERGSRSRGIKGLKKCAIADQMLKSSKIDDTLLLSQIIADMSEAKSC